MLRDFVSTGLLLLVLGVEVSLSFIQSHFLLELKPLWSKGVLRYGYKDTSFSEILPVITSSVRAWPYPI
jgi:hypothetical protein